MNNLEDATMMLLVRRSESESEADLFTYLQARYPHWPDQWKIGQTFLFRDQKFAQIQTFAGSLIMRIAFDTRKGKFERMVIYRFDSTEPFQLLNPDGSKSEVDEGELIPSKD